MNAKLTAERLKKLRENANLSHAKLKVALEEKYNIKISEASLKKYEITKTDHVNYGDVKGMKIEYLEMFADFYNVSTDYLLGRTKSKSTDVTTRQITDITGLSIEAIENLKQLQNMKKEQINELYAEINPAFVFDCMLSNMSFTSIFPFHLLKYCKMKNEQSINTTTKETINSDMQFNFLNSTISTNMERYFIINQIEHFIDDVYETYMTIQKYRQNL